MKQEHTNMKHTLVEKKNSIVNYVIIKNHAKAYKNVKNITKRFLNEKKKCVFAQWKKSHIINLTINIKLIIKLTDSQENMLNEKNINV